MKIGTFSGSVMSAGLGLIILATSVVAQNAPPKGKSHKPVSPPVGVVPEDMSPEAAEVVWLFHHNGTSDSILRYVNKSHVDFKLSVEDVNYLKDIGVSTDVVLAMIRSPEMREMIVRLRNREPRWPTANHPKQETPQPALENIELRQNEQLEGAPQNYPPPPHYFRPPYNAVPPYYGPAYGPVPGPYPVPQGQPNGVPAPVPVPNNGFDNQPPPSTVPQ